MNRNLATDLAWGAGILGLALLASEARKSGWLDHETVTRLVVGMTGLMVASFGNRLPKTFVPDARARESRRVAGWSLVLSGLVYAGLWAFAPVSVAVVAGSGAVLLGIAVTIGHGLYLCGKGVRRAGPGAGDA